MTEPADPTAPIDPIPRPADAASPGERLPPNPVKYDAPRNVAARARGLPTPYIPGGEDPELTKTLREERRYLRWLLIMVGALVSLGFVLGIAGAIFTALLRS